MDIFVKDIHGFVDEKEREISTVAAGLRSLVDRLGENPESRRWDPDFSKTLVKLSEIIGNTKASFTKQQVTNFLVERLIQVQEDERKIIAREIHDTLAQSLANIVIRMDFCLELLPKNQERAIEEIRELKQLLKSKIGELRKLMFHLHPLILDEAGLITAVRKFVENYRQGAGMSVNLLIEIQNVMMERKASTSLFRVMQEALINAKKHAAATAVDVELCGRADFVELLVSDNGKGFDVQSVIGPNRRWDKFGLASMSERIELAGGIFEIVSKRGSGTSVRAKLPIKQTPAM